MGTDLLSEVRAAGITLSLDGGNLVATPKAAITDELRDLIRAHKAELLATLAADDINLDEVLPAACAGVAGITPEVFRSLLSPEDVQDIEAGDIAVETLRGYALSFAEGIDAGRIVVSGGEP